MSSHNGHYQQNGHNDKAIVGQEQDQEKTWRTNSHILKHSKPQVWSGMECVLASWFGCFLKQPIFIVQKSAAPKMGQSFARNHQIQSSYVVQQHAMFLIILDRHNLTYQMKKNTCLCCSAPQKCVIILKLLPT